MKLVLAAFLSLALTGVAAAQPAEPSTRDFEFLIGDWRGESTLFSVLRPDAEPINETAISTCAYVLANAHIQCEATWTSTAGRSRSYFLFVNFNRESQAYETLYIYDNYSSEVAFPLAYDDRAGAYIGYFDTIGPNNEPARERIEWRVSAGADQISFRVFVGLASQPEESWGLNFDGVWRRERR